MLRLHLPAFVSLLFVLGTPLASAQNCTTSWTASSGGDWSEPGNWSAGVPTASSTACITLNGTYTVAGPTGTIAIGSLVLGGSSGTQTLVLDHHLDIATTGEIRVNGVLEWTSDYLLSGTLTNTGRVRLVGTTTSRGVRGENAVFRNEGTIEWESSGQFYIYFGGRVENASLWTVLGDGELLGFGTTSGTFVNTGTVRKEGTGTMNINSAFLAVENAGTFEVLGGTMEVESPSTHTNASFVVAEDATLVFETRSPHFEGTTTGDPAGSLRIERDFTAGADAVWDIGGTGMEWAAGVFHDGMLTNLGLVRLTGTSSRSVRGGATFRNEGTVEWESNEELFIYQDARVENAGLWTVLGEGDLFGFSSDGTFVNEATGTVRKEGSGTMRLATGNLFVENAGVFDVGADGAFSIDRPFAHLDGAVFQGDGTIRVRFGQLDHAGDTAPTGVLTWSGVSGSGSFAPEPTSALHIDIGGTTPGTEHDQLVVDGTAQLDGQLVVSLDDGYTPSNDDTFTILTASSLALGAELVGLTENGISLYPAFSDTDLTLTAAVGVPTLSGSIAVTPDLVFNGGMAEITITGTGFAPDASVRLLCNDCIDPDAFGEVAGFARSISPTEIVAVFDLTNDGIAGIYDVEVTDPRGGTATTPISITPENLTVSVVATDAEAGERGSERGTFEVRSSVRLAEPLDVRFAVSGTATRYLDYALNTSRTLVRIPRGETTAVVAVVPLADGEIEGMETVELTLDTDDVGYEIGVESATVSIADGPPPTSFDILASQPRRGGAGPVTLTLSGQSIAPDATVELSCSGTTYDAVSASAAPSGTSLFAQFELTGQAPTPCDLTVNSGGDSRTLSGAFDVEETLAPDLSIELISPTRRRRGRTVRHRVIITNRGNLDAFMVPVEIVVNAGAVIETEFNVLLPEEEPDFPDFGSWDDIDIQQTVEGRTILPIVLLVVPARGEVELSFYSDASRVTASVLTPLLSSVSFESGEATLAPEYVEQFARVSGAQSTGELALCWANKLIFFAFDLVATQVSAISQCVISLGSHVVQSFLFLLSSEENHRLRKHQDTLAFSGVVTSLMGTFATCLSVGGRTVLPWVQVGAFVWGFITAVNDAANNCPRKPRESETEVVNSFDPNDKLGPAGVDVERYFRGEEDRLSYTVRFENLVTATAPAAEVFVTDTLDVSVFDPATFSLGSITFGDSTVTPPPGLQAWSTTLDLRPERPMLLQISGSMDAEGLIQWAFTTLDPNTNDIPEDPLIGFLPPNATAPEGEGSVSFSVGLRDGLADGTRIENDARIVFDLNEPIDTPPWSNTLDRSLPTSRVVDILPSSTSDTTLVLSITSSDDGSGVLDYDIYASRDGGPFELAFTARPDDSAFQAERGSVYSFFSLARDRVGNREPAKTEAEATTRWPVDAGDSEPSLPDAVTLVEPYPNPTRGDAVVQFGLPTPDRATLRVYDVQGREVARITDEEHAAGWHRLPWRADGLAPGVYILRLQVGDERLTERLTVVR